MQRDIRGTKGDTLHCERVTIEQGAWRKDTLHSSLVQKGAKEFLVETDYPLVCCCHVLEMYIIGCLLDR
jgi:hypothetical protein